jgi:hypothetical protein
MLGTFDLMDAIAYLTEGAVRMQIFSQIWENLRVHAVSDRDRLGGGFAVGTDWIDVVDRRR